MINGRDMTKPLDSRNFVTVSEWAMFSAFAIVLAIGFALGVGCVLWWQA